MIQKQSPEDLVGFFVSNRMFGARDINQGLWRNVSSHRFNSIIQLVNCSRWLFLTIESASATRRRQAHDVLLLCRLMSERRSLWLILFSEQALRWITDAAIWEYLREKERESLARYSKFSFQASNFILSSWLDSLSISCEIFNLESSLLFDYGDYDRRWTRAERRTAMEMLHTASCLIRRRIEG